MNGINKTPYIILARRHKCSCFWNKLFDYERSNKKHIPITKFIFI